MKQFNLEEYIKNPLRKVVTRGRDTVKIHCTDFDDSEYPIIARVEGTSVSTSFTKDGKYIKSNGDSKYDLFFAPEKHERYISLYKVNGEYQLGTTLLQKEDAEIANRILLKQDPTYVTIVKIEWEE